MGRDSWNIFSFVYTVRWMARSWNPGEKALPIPAPPLQLPHSRMPRGYLQPWRRNTVLEIGSGAQHGSTRHWPAVLHLTPPDWASGTLLPGATTLDTSPAAGPVIHRNNQQWGFFQACLRFERTLSSTNLFSSRP